MGVRVLGFCFTFSLGNIARLVTWIAFGVGFFYSFSKFFINFLFSVHKDAR